MSEYDPNLAAEGVDQFSDEDLLQTNITFKPVSKPEEFKDKAAAILSDAMDYLSHKIKNGMAEASDIKTALEIGKQFKVGIETVDDAARKALEEQEEYDRLAREHEAEDNDPIARPSYRFED